MDNVISTGYVPRKFQEELHLYRKRFNVFPCHRRFGKTVYAINDKVDLSFRNLRHNPQYAYFAPFFGQAKRVAWEYMKDATKRIPGVQHNEAELRTVIPRPKYDDKITLYLLGADNPTANLGMYLDGVTLDEYGEMDPMIWTRVLRPMLSDRNGWATFIGTVKGDNHFKSIYEQAIRNKSGEWYARMFKASETGIIPQTELDSMREELFEQTGSDDTYNQEMECDWSAALVGAYYGKLMRQAEEQKRITKVPYEPSCLVSTSWDLGISDTTCIWFFQQVGREIRVIDYLEDAGQGLAFYAEALRKKGYSYDEHFLPHDAAARDLSTGHTRQETLRTLGVAPVRIIPRQAIEDRINATRVLLPKVWFDAEKCARGINSLKSYERKYDSKLKIYLSSPLHNWASHGADAFGCFALSYRDESKKVDRMHLPRQTESDYDIFGR